MLEIFQKQTKAILHAAVLFELLLFTNKLCTTSKHNFSVNAESLSQTSAERDKNSAGCHISKGFFVV